MNVKAEDRTDQFVKMLEKELKHIENIKDDFVKVVHRLVFKDWSVIAVLFGCTLADLGVGKDKFYHGPGVASEKYV